MSMGIPISMEEIDVPNPLTNNLPFVAHAWRWTAEDLHAERTDVFQTDYQNRLSNGDPAIRIIWFAPKESETGDTD